MKNLSGTFKLMVLAAIGVLAIFTLRAFAAPPPPEPDASKATFVLKIKNVTPVKDAARFEQVLKHLQTQLYEIDMVDEKGNHTRLVPGSHAKLDIKTDKVTTSEVAKSAATGELTFIATRTTIQVPSMYASDIQAVLGELQ